MIVIFLNGQPVILVKTEEDAEQQIEKLYLKYCDSALPVSISSRKIEYADDNNMEYINKRGKIKC